MINSDDPRHGTVNGYTNWSCRCQPCTTAHSAFVAEQRRLRAQQGLPVGDERHGTVNGYVNLSCRCQPCTKAHSRYVRERRAARRGE